MRARQAVAARGARYSAGRDIKRMRTLWVDRRFTQPRSSAQRSLPTHWLAAKARLASLRTQPRASCKNDGRSESKDRCRSECLRTALPAASPAPYKGALKLAERTDCKSARDRSAVCARFRGLCQTGGASDDRSARAGWGVECVDSKIMMQITAWLPWLQTLALCMMRPFGVMVLLPVMSARSLGGALARNALALLIATPVLPHAWVAAPEGLGAYNASAFLITGISELSAGLAIGLMAAVPFWAMNVAGELIDTVRGSGLSEIINPTTGGQVSLFSLLLTQLITALFFVDGGFNQLLEAIYRSYTILPIGAPLSLSRATAAFIIAQWQLMVDLGVRFALPAVAVMMMVDFSLGLINQTAERLDVFFIAMPVKSLLACLALSMSMRLALEDYFEWFSAIGMLIHQLFT